MIITNQRREIDITTVLKYLQQSKELDNGGFTIRCLLIVATAAILALKVYLLLFVMDFVLGIYSFFSSFLLLNILIFAYLKYRDPYYVSQLDDTRISEKDTPLFSLVVPVKNEEEDIRYCVESCLNQTYENKEIIVINDGSTDSTPKILDSIRRENSHVKNFYILHLSKSVGKKKAVEAASQIAKGDIYAFMDSDCAMALDAVEKAAKIFMSDERLGALTGHVIVRDASKGTIFEKMQAVYTDASCRIFKGAETTFASVTCCSGALSFYRRESVQDFIHEWAHDKFLGMDFKFCTDRRMTAHVLSTGPRRPQQRNDDYAAAAADYADRDRIPRAATILNSSTNAFTHAGQIQDIYRRRSSPLAYSDNGDNKSFNSTSPSQSVSFRPGESDRIHSSDSSRSPPVEFFWNVKYSYSIKVYVVVPRTLNSLVQQQIRWKKSFIRSLSTTGGTYWRRPAYIALLYYITTAMKFVRPYVVFHAVFMLPFVGDSISTLLWFAGILFTSMIYGVDYKLRNPGSKLWLYRPAFTILTTFVYTWLLPVAMINIRSKSWR
jgi:hyaluronan synthase